MTRLRLIAFAFATSVSANCAAAATLVMHYLETPTGIVATASGSVDLTGGSLLLPAAPLTASFLQPGIPQAFIGVGDHDQYYFAVSGPANFGTGPATAPSTSSSGGPVGFNFYVTGTDMFVLVPDNYVSGTAISATAFFANETFADAGITVPNYQFTVGNTTFDMQFDIAPAAVPLPASMYLLAAGLAGFVPLRRRWRR